MKVEKELIGNQRGPGYGGEVGEQEWLEGRVDMMKL
jgi:hypothetical protein